MFLPDYHLQSLLQIDLDFLKKAGLRALVLDVDNTLTTHGNPVPAAGVLEWIGEMRAEGLPMLIVSNNSHERVEPFARLLGLEFVSRGAKPLPAGFRRAQERFGLPAAQIGAVGDQIFTDILGGNLAGLTTILVDPITPETGPFFRFKRGLEKPFIRRMNRQKK